MRSYPQTLPGRARAAVVPGTLAGGRLRALSLQGCIRQTPSPAPARLPRDPTPGGRSEPQRCPARGGQKTVHDPLAAPESGGAAPVVPPAGLVPDSDSAAPAARPLRL